MVTPTSPWTAFELGSKTADPLAMYLNDFCTVPMSLAGIPGISIPSGLSDGLPVGFQLAGPAFSESRLLDAAYALEQAIGFDGSTAWAERRAGDGMSGYEPVIGLEIHVQLKTRTKMFCGCELSFGDPPNIHCCPVCLGLPGRAAGAQRARRRLRGDDRPGPGFGDRAAVDLSPQELLLSRLAQGLPDLPVRRAHLPRWPPRRRPHPPRAPGGGRRQAHPRRGERTDPRADRSVVDFNRCGTPLVEIVTEPDLHSPEQAHDWLILLRTTLRQLGVSDVNMDEGSLRCDANVSIRPAG